MSYTEPYRILQVGMSPYYGGTEAFLMTQYRKIDRTRIQFDFLNVYDCEIACQKEITDLGGRIYHLNMARHKGLRNYYRNLDRFFYENAGKFHGIHCNFQSLINVDLLKYAKKYGIPVRIAHAHNAGYGTEPRFFQKVLIFWNGVVLHRYATDYFACSDLAAQWMFGRNAVVINNAIDAKAYKYDRQIRMAVREKLGLTTERVVIFVGRLDPQKNPLFLLDIFQELRKFWPESRLLIVGDGVLKDEMLDRIEALGIAAYVSILGTRSDVSALLQAADVFLLPSLFEGLGIVLVEAQAAGLPTFTSEKVVPEAVKLTDLLSYISLDAPARAWAEHVARRGTEVRRDTYDEIVHAGYDSTTNAEKLQALYLQIIDER